jgi:hypothetical protein
MKSLLKYINNDTPSQCSKSFKNVYSNFNSSKRKKTIIKTSKCSDLLVETPFDSELICSKHIDLSEQSNRPLIFVKINNIRKIALLDTGSNSNVCSRKTLISCNLENSIINNVEKFEIVQACGSITSLGTVFLEVNFPTGSYRLKFVVIDGLSEEIIIGHPSLVKLKINVLTTDSMWSQNVNNKLHRFEFVENKIDTDVYEVHNVLPSPLLVDLFSTEQNTVQSNDSTDLLSHESIHHSSLIRSSSIKVNEPTTDSVLVVESNRKAFFSEGGNLIDFRGESKTSINEHLLDRSEEESQMLLSPVLPLESIENNLLVNVINVDAYDNTLYSDSDDLWQDYNNDVDININLENLHPIQVLEPTPLKDNIYGIDAVRALIKNACCDPQIKKLLFDGLSPYVGVFNKKLGLCKNYEHVLETVGSPVQGRRVGVANGCTAPGRQPEGGACSQSSKKMLFLMRSSLIEYK